jgi:DNA polymerase elongation subunit (family B)
MNFYTNVTRHRNQILVRGISEGKPVKFSVKYKPYLFVKASTQTEHKNLKGEYVGKLQFDSMSETYKFTEKYKKVEGMEIYGLSDWPYMYIYDKYRGEIKYDPALVSVCSIDIETSIEGGFPDIEKADNEITAITIGRNGRKTTFGCGEYQEHQDNVQYYKCVDESALLLAFLEVWNGSLYSPDVVTGWNIEFFDIPYLVNRMRKVIGSNHADRLSPWKILREYTVNSRGRDCICYAPIGIAVLDYIKLYRKFTYTEQESYRLDYIAQVELGEGKIDYHDEGYTDLDDLRLRNFQRYIEYNVRDVEIVDRLEDKLKLIELVYALSYDAKVNYEDTMTTVKQWDVITHNYLLDRNIVVPLNDKNKPDRAFVGGYVKDPKVGMSKWVVSFDLNSLYPHLIMQYNISPETFVTRLQDKVSIDDLLVGGASQFGDYLDKTNCTIAANLCIYTKEKRGFLPSIMDRMYDDRTRYKKQMIECKKEYEKTKEPQLVKEIARLDNMQMAKKIQLNSAYGALGNKWFRWFDVNNAEAITTSGQLSIRWIENKLNDYLNKLLKTENFDYVLASDTDSVYVTLEYLVKNVFGDDVPETKKVIQYIDKICKERIEPFIDRSYQELADYMHAYAQKMQMKRENIADKGIWKAKKMYILNVWNSEGVEYDKPKLKMAGIEAVRSSTPTACRGAIKDSLEIIMSGSELDLQKYVANFKSQFSSLKFEDIAFTRGVKDIEKYWVCGRFQSQTPIHVRGSVVYNEMLKKKKLTNKYQSITSGEKIKFAYLKIPNPTQDYVIACQNGLPKELKMETYVDYAVQFEKGYLGPIESITNTLGWQAEKRATLEDWYK